MEQLFCGIEAGKSNERVYTREELLTLCAQVDKWVKPRRNVESNFRTDYSVRDGSLNESFKSGLSIQSIIQTAVFSDEEDAEDNDQILNYFISETLLGNNIDPTPTRVRRISARGAQIPKPTATQHENDFKHFCNVMHENNKPSEQNGCPFFLCKGSCKNDNCKFAHAQRSRTLCRAGSEGSNKCKYGAFCRNTHSDDKYPIWFRSRKRKGEYRLFVWKTLNVRSLNFSY